MAGAGGAELFVRHAAVWVVGADGMGLSSVNNQVCSVVDSGIREGNLFE